MKILVLVTVAEAELFNRMPQGFHRNVIDIRQSLVFDLAQLGIRFSCRFGRADFHGRMAQTQIHLLRHHVGIFGLESLWAFALGHQTVFQAERDKILPEAAIVNGRIHNELNFTVEQITVCRANDLFKIGIRFFQLIVEIEMGFRKLKGFHIEFFHHDLAQRIQRSKIPAAPRFLLIGALTLFRLMRENKGMTFQHLMILRRLVDTDRRDRLFHRSIQRIFMILLLEAFKLFERDIRSDFSHENLLFIETPLIMLGRAPECKAVEAHLMGEQRNSIDTSKYFDMIMSNEKMTDHKKEL